MSLVGPRPLFAEDLVKFTNEQTLRLSYYQESQDYYKLMLGKQMILIYGLSMTKST